MKKRRKWAICPGKGISMPFILSLLAACWLTGCGAADESKACRTADAGESCGAAGNGRELNLEMGHGDEPENGVITLMHVDSEKKEFQDFIKKAESELKMQIRLAGCPVNPDSRHAKISLLLSSGDSSVDVISVNDEMISEFKHTGWIEPLQDEVMNAEAASHFPQEYMRQMVMVDDQIYSVPYAMDILSLWVNESYLKEAGLSGIGTKEQFMQFLAHDWGKGRFSYGGSWEKTYAYNEIGEFINLFGGNYFDWNNEKTRDAVTFLKECIDLGYSSKEQLFDQYDQTSQKFINGEYGLILTYSGMMSSLSDAGAYGSNRIRLTLLPDMGAGRTTYLAAWQYVLNKASEHKASAIRFLEYAASLRGSIQYAEAMNRMPARTDATREGLFDITGYEDIKRHLDSVQQKARPLSANSIEHISEMGILFQKYIVGELDLSAYCDGMQALVDRDFQ